MRSQLRTKFMWINILKVDNKTGKTKFRCVLYWKILSKYTYNIQNTINISTHLWKYFSQFFKTFGEIEIALKKTGSKYYRRAFTLYHVHWNYIFAMYYYLEGKRKYHDINFYREYTFTGIWSDVAGGSIYSRELQQRRRRRLRKRHLKVCSRGFKLHRVYSISFNSSNAGEFVWSWILNDWIKVQGKRKRVVVLSSRPPKKRAWN